MSFPVLTNLDLNRNQLLNAGLQQLAADPAAPFEGQIWQNTASDEFKAFLNGAIVVIQSGPITSADILDGTIVDGDVAAANKDGAAGTPSMRTIGAGAGQAVAGNDARLTDQRVPTDGSVTDLKVAGGAGIAETKLALASDAAAGTPSRRSLGAGATQAMPGNTRLDTIAPPSTSVALAGQKITGLADGANAQDAATKGQVDAAVAGLDAKLSVRVGSTGNLALTGTQTIDGIVVVAGDRVLAKNQTVPSENGIWVVAAGAWSRATDMDSWVEVPGAHTFVEQGTTNADTGWVSLADAGGNLGATAITWTKFSAAASTALVKYAADIAGDGAATQFTVAHNLGTTDVHVQVWDVSADLLVLTDVKRPTNATCRIDFAVAPVNGKVYRVVVVG